MSSVPSITMPWATEHSSPGHHFHFDDIAKFDSGPQASPSTHAMPFQNRDPLSQDALSTHNDQFISGREQTHRADMSAQLTANSQRPTSSLDYLVADCTQDAPEAGPSTSKRRKKQKSDEERKQEAHQNGVFQPLSKLTKDSDIPLKDTEAWVHRSTAERYREIESRRDHAIGRPMNSFMLYRSAYAERVKEYSKENNHQKISQLSGWSWILEDPEIKAKYDRWASIERKNHQAAFPDYKFAPVKVKAFKKRRRDETRDDDIFDLEHAAAAAAAVEYPQHNQQQQQHHDERYVRQRRSAPSTISMPGSASFFDLPSSSPFYDNQVNRYLDSSTLTQAGDLALTNIGNDVRSRAYSLPTASHVHSPLPGIHYAQQYFPNPHTSPVMATPTAGPSTLGGYGLPSAQVIGAGLHHHPSPHHQRSHHLPPSTLHYHANFTTRNLSRYPPLPYQQHQHHHTGYLHVPPAANSDPHAYAHNSRAAAAAAVAVVDPTLEAIMNTPALTHTNATSSTSTSTQTYSHSHSNQSSPAHVAHLGQYYPSLISPVNVEGSSVAPTWMAPSMDE